MKKFLKFFIYFSLGLMGLIQLSFQFPKYIVYNRTNSLPTGFYIVDKSQPVSVSRGTIACFKYFAQAWEVNRKYLPEGYFVCKRVVGVPGDYLSYSNGVAIVNTLTGQTLKYPLLKQDSKGRPLPEIADYAPQKITDKKYFLVGVGPRSLDSRYTGLESYDNLSYTVTPLITSKQ